jgi:hypothetical protein
MRHRTKHYRSTEYAYRYSLRHANLDLRLDYAMLGFNRYSGTDKAQGYGGLMAPEQRLQARTTGKW